ncbi:MAG TPA: NUDIX domain-containing protein [Anaerolineae bacterium]|nr:NUDIX domain-containing protein [Anaerolineae bacterium]
MHCLHCASELVEKRIDGRERLVCPACGWVFYRGLKVGAGMLIQNDGRLLLIKRAVTCDAFPDTWSLPAGYCEVDEAPAAAAEREALEELGLRLHAGRLFDVYFFDDDPRGNGVLVVYEAYHEGEGVGQPDLALSTEVAAAEFFAAGALPEPLCGAGHDRATLAWQARALDRWVPGGALRFCPHCAYPLEERDAYGRQRLACRVCGYVEFRQLKVGVSLVIEREGRILLIRRAVEPGKGLWALPSGFVEWDERPEAAVCRECIEETGLVAGPPQLMAASYYRDDFRGPGINLTYRVTAIGGRLKAGDDAGDARFFPLDELPPADEIAFSGHADTLQKLVRHRQMPP